LIERLAPDLILTQDLCAVCAVSSREVGELCSVRAEVLSFDPGTIAGIEEAIGLLARRLGVPERGDEVVAGMRRTIASVRETVDVLPRPRVFLAEWLDPPFAPGHWLPELVELAGGECVLGEPGERSFPTDWEVVRGCTPDLVVAAPCGYDERRAATEAAASIPELDCRVVAVDGNGYYSRPAPRVAHGVAQLGFLLHPDVVPDPGLPWLELSPGPTRRAALAREGA
ncbi:MAG: ABC transporter substrate-binding protein, partial [Actinomycetota bacterium]|nr:ABC transporter substrate-binding protein [Actinomycetota bacterium]